MRCLKFKIEDRESPFTRTEAEQIADEQIAEFGSWYASHFKDQDPLTKFEKAILKTYLVYAMDGTMTD